jgi:hypothetical protein
VASETYKSVGAKTMNAIESAHQSVTSDFDRFHARIASINRRFGSMVSIDADASDRSPSSSSSVAMDVDASDVYPPVRIMRHSDDASKKIEMRSVKKNDSTRADGGPNAGGDDAALRRYGEAFMAMFDDADADEKRTSTSSTKQKQKQKRKQRSVVAADEPTTKDEKRQRRRRDDGRRRRRETRTR